MKTIFLIEGFEPFDLLHMSKDAFYQVIEQEFSKFNNNKALSVSNANLEFVSNRVEHSDFISIQVEILDYTIEE